MSDTPNDSGDGDVLKMAAFEWDAQRQQVAILLAQGYTERETAVQAKVSERTIRRWKQHVEFLAEVDRLTLMSDIANRAYRLRMAMRVVRKKARQKSTRDLLDWMRYAQSETDGAKLDLAAFADVIASVAGGESTGDSGAAPTGDSPGGRPSAC